MQGERIVLLGAGRVATQLARALSLWPSEGQRLQLYSPGGHSARRLAAKLTGEVSVARSLSELDKDADCYIFAVPDTVIAPLASELAELGIGTSNRALWVHVSGATPLVHLAEHHSESAVLYPLQTFSTEREQDFRQIPLYLEGNTPVAREAVEALGHRLSDVVSWATTEQRQVLHIAAVVACNFSNYLIGRAELLLEAEGLSPKALLPLLDEMNDKLHQLPAVEAQTGPAQRGDAETMQRHCVYLETHGEKDLAKLYETLSTAIQLTHGTGASEVK